MKLETILKLSQADLFALLAKKFSRTAIVNKDNFILVKGVAPIMLLAHLDTVHSETVKNICTSEDGNILMSPQGIGGDDRCGVFALLKVYDLADVKPFLLFTCQEEVGGIGAQAFCHYFISNLLPASLDSLKMLVEIDRKGYNDAVYYDCCNPNFEDYISRKGFITAQGSFSDISIIAPTLGVAAVNLSAGYYNAHTLHEFINRLHLENTIRRVVDIISDSVKDSCPKYEYIDYFDYANYYCDSDLPDDLPVEYEDIYQELLQCYSVDELEDLRKHYGNNILEDIYFHEFQDSDD